MVSMDAVMGELDVALSIGTTYLGEKVVREKE